MPFLKLTPQPIPSAKLLIHAITTLSSQTDTHHLQLQLNTVLEKALTTHNPDQADTILSLLDSAQKLNLKLSPKTHAVTLKFLKRLDKPDSSNNATLYRVWAHLIHHADSHPSLNLNINSIFKRFCLEPNFDSTMGPALIHYAVTKSSPVSTTHLLSAIGSLSDVSPYLAYITALITNERVILSQPLEPFLKISKQLLGSKNPAFQSVLKPLLTRTDLNPTQHTLILDQWLPIQSITDTINLIESVDLLLQIRPNFQIPRKFHQPLLEGLKQAPTSTPFPKSLDLISNLLLKDSARLFADLLPVFALSSTPIPSTLNTLVTSKDIFSEAICIDSFIGFCAQSLIPALTGDTQGSVTKFLCSALEYYSKQVCPNDFLALTQYILSLSDAHLALKAELLGLSLKLIPTALLEHKPIIEAGYLALPFSRLTPQQRLDYIRIHPDIEVFRHIQKHDVTQWGLSTFKELLDRLIATHINHPDFGDILSHYCSLHERGFGQFNADSFHNILNQFHDHPTQLSSFFEKVTRKSYISQYEDSIFSFLNENPSCMSSFIHSTSLEGLSSIFIKASRYLATRPDNTNWDLLLEVALERQIRSNPITLFLSAVLKKQPKPKMRFSAYPNLLSKLASQKQYEIEKQHEQEKSLITDATRNIQQLFSQADRAWRSYLMATTSNVSFPLPEINNILNAFKLLPLSIQKAIVKKPFSFNTGQEFIYSLPFLTGNIDDLLFFHNTLQISTKETLLNNPQLIALCIDRNDSEFLKQLFELEISPNSKLHLIHENQTLSIFDYSLKRKSQNCTSVIFDHPNFNQIQLFDFIAHSALHGDLETLSFIPSIPSLKEPSQTAQETMLERLITRIRQHPERKIPVQSLPSFAYLVQIGLINPSGNVPNHKQHSTPLSALSLALVLESSDDLHYDPSLHGLSTFLMHHGASLHHPDLSNILLLIYVRFKCFNTSAHPILENLKEALQSHSDPINSNSLKLLFSESEFQVEQHALTLVTEIDRFFGSSIKATLDHCKLTALAVRHFPKYPSVAEFLHTRGYTFDAFAFNNIHLNCVAAKYATLPVFQKLEEFGMPLDTTLELPHPVQNFGVMMNQVNLAELLYLLNLSTKLIPGMKSRIPDMESKLQFLTEKGLTIRPLVNEKSAELSALFLPLNLNL